MSIGYNPKVVTSGLVCYWDALNTKSYPGSGTSWLNLVGTNTGTLTNGPTYSSGTIVFDGVDDHVVASDIGNLSNFTCEALVKLNAAQSGSPCYVTNIYPGTNSKVNFALGHVTGASTISCGFYDGTWHYSPTFTPTTNTWYHVSGSYDGSSIKLFINGVSQGTPTSYAGTPTTSAGGIRIGRRWDLAEYFNGSIAFVKIYNRALSNLEIKQNFNAARGRVSI